MNILIKLVGVGNSGCKKRLNRADQYIKSHRVDLRDNVLWDTESASIPSSGNLARNEAVELQSLRDQEGSTLLQAYSILTRLGYLEDLNLIAVFPFEFLSGLF